MQSSSRYLIGIDLGTTNSVVAYVDTHRAEGERSDIRVFEVPQLMGPGELRSIPALPSFLYFPAQDELQSGTLTLPWDRTPQAVAGAMARDHGALLPTRQVMSAKSWLSHGGVDRRAKILPRDAERPLISPVEASARYLLHLRNSWNLAFATDGQGDASLFERQDIVLTVPASFDEEARELTVESARQAGLENLTLLEEPLAAFYAWIAQNDQSLSENLSDGDLVLICDIGGGTSDFSLVRARIAGDDVQFEREAIGEHLLLGGDNLDLALAHLVRKKLNGARLSMRQMHALQRACCAAKERLLGDDSPDYLPITLLGGGRAVVGQMLTAELHRDEVLEILSSGFLPLAGADDLPKVKAGSSAGLRELGLPYASDPAITRHLIAFLTQAALITETEMPAKRRARLAQPDAVLFNGGFCVPRITRERILEVITGLNSESSQARRPQVLHSDVLGSAVAQGAAHYGRVRRGLGKRIRAGSARTYYIGLRADERLQGLCVLPYGVEEGTTLPLPDRKFVALANRPVSFTLLSSRTRHHAHGEVAELQENEVHRHAPLVTVLRYGKMREVQLDVRLRVTFTELGTLEVWCESVTSPHSWRLQFELRGAQGQQANESENQAAMPNRSGASSVVSEHSLEAAAELIRLAFGNGKAESTGDATAPETLANRLETSLGLKRDAWPTDVIRRCCDVLIETANGRRKSPQHEVRWLNLVGFCLRPGFGMTGDDVRVRQIRNFSLSGPVFAGELQSEVQWLVLLRRISGGLNASQQHESYKKLLPMLGLGGGKKKGRRLNPQLEYEAWRLVSSLEHLPAPLRAPLGDELVRRIRKDPSDGRLFWPVARIGARIPLYGPLNCVIAPDKCSEWLNAVLEHSAITPELATVIVLLARRTGDRSRDLDPRILGAAVRALRTAEVEPELVQRLETLVPPERSDAVRMFGESLPRDLRLVSSANCLLSMTALTSGPERVA